MGQRDEEIIKVLEQAGGMEVVQLITIKRAANEKYVIINNFPEVVIEGNPGRTEDDVCVIIRNLLRRFGP